MRTSICCLPDPSQSAVGCGNPRAQCNPLPLLTLAKITGAKTFMTSYLVVTSVVPELLCLDS